MTESPSVVPQVGVGAIVFKEGRVLLVKRGRPPSQGLWAIPGGRLEAGESLQRAAERELFEETGVVILAKQPVLTFDMIDRDEAGKIRFHYVIVDLEGEYISGEPLANDDAEDARWVSPEELGEFAVSDTTRELLRDRYHFG